MSPPGMKRLCWLPGSEASGGASLFLSCSLMLASEELVRDLPEHGSQGSQANHQGADFAGGIGRFRAARDDLAQFVQLAQHAVPVGLWPGQFGCGAGQALLG